MMFSLLSTFYSLLSTSSFSGETVMSLRLTNDDENKGRMRAGMLKSSNAG
ncbi:MAG: hypothetical protein AB1422_11380 [bacterium]